MYVKGAGEGHARTIESERREEKSKRGQERGGEREKLRKRKKKMGHPVGSAFRSSLDTFTYPAERPIKDRYDEDPSLE